MITICVLDNKHPLGSTVLDLEMYQMQLLPMILKHLLDITPYDVVLYRNGKGGPHFVIDTSRVDQRKQQIARAVAWVGN